MATTCPTSEKEKARLKNQPVRTFPASCAEGGGLGVNEASAVTTGMGPAGACPCLTCGHLAGSRLLGEWSETKTQSGLLPVEQSLLYLAHCGLSHMLDRTGGDDLREEGRQDLFHILPSFFYPQPLVLGIMPGSSWPSSINAFPWTDFLCFP